MARRGYTVEDGSNGYVSGNLSEAVRTYNALKRERQRSGGDIEPVRVQDLPITSERQSRLLAERQERIRRSGSLSGSTVEPPEHEVEEEASPDG